MPPKKSDKKTGFISPPPPHDFADNDGFVPESSKNKALAALFLCASEEYHQQCEVETKKHNGNDDDDDENNNLLFNCNSTLSSISAASFSIADAMYFCKARTAPRLNKDINHENTYYSINEEAKALSIYASAKHTPNGKILSSLGDQRTI